MDHSLLSRTFKKLINTKVLTFDLDSKALNLKTAIGMPVHVSCIIGHENYRTYLCLKIV